MVNTFNQKDKFDDFRLNMNVALNQKSCKTNNIVNKLLINKDNIIDTSNNKDNKDIKRR